MCIRDSPDIRAQQRHRYECRHRERRFDQTRPAQHELIVRIRNLFELVTALELLQIAFKHPDSDEGRRRLERFDHDVDWIIKKQDSRIAALFDDRGIAAAVDDLAFQHPGNKVCLLYTSPSPTRLLSISY